MSGFRAATAALTVLLCAAVVAIWIGARWPWAAFQIAVFALASACAVWLAVRGIRPSMKLALLAPAAMAVCGLVQLAAGTTVNRWNTTAAVLDWFTWLALAWLGLQLFGDGKARRWFLDGFLYFSFVLSVVAILQRFTAAGKVYWLFPSGFDDNILGPFVSQNQYAAYIELVLPLALAGIWRDRRRAWLYVIMAGVMFASVIAGASRAGSTLAAIEIVAVLGVAQLRGRVSGRATVAGVAATAAAFTAVVGWDVLWSRFQQQDPYAGRRELLLSSIDMVRDRPWSGFGLGNWPTAYPRYARFDDGTYVNQAHNDWAQWAVEAGLPGFAAMVGFALLLAGPALRSIWGLGLISVLLHALVDYPFQQRPALTACFFILAAAVLCGGGRVARRLESGVLL